MSTTINANQSYFSDYNAFTSIKLNDDTFTPTNNSYSNSPGTDNANDFGIKIHLLFILMLKTFILTEY